MRFDLRTALVVLGAVTLGYVICLAMPVAQAEPPDVVTVDQILVTDEPVYQIVHLDMTFCMVIHCEGKISPNEQVQWKCSDPVPCP